MIRRRKSANVLATSGRLHFCSRAFPRSCSDTAAFCCTIPLFEGTTQSNGHSYNFLFFYQFFPKIPRYPRNQGSKKVVIMLRQCLWCCRHDRAIARVHLVHLMNVEWRQAAADPKPR